MPPTRRITRRAFATAALPAVASISIAASLPLILAGCGLPPEAERSRRFVASLRSALAGAAPGGALAPPPMDAVAALATLRGDLSPLRFYALSWNETLLRRFLAGRRERDLRAGRTRFVDGWLLAESEIAIAALLGR